MSNKNESNYLKHDEAGGLEILSVPGAQFKLTTDNIDYKLHVEGHLKYLCQPFVDRINSRLKGEKPAKVTKDGIIASTWLPPIPSNVFNRLIRAEFKTALGNYVPETVSFEITRDCKCNCEHCVVSGGEGEIDIKKIKSTIDEALDMGCFIITFTEGDPLLRDEIFELIDYVDKDRAIVNIFTPGTEINLDTAKRLKDAGLHNLLVSLYSTEPSKHDSVRKLEGAFDSAVSAIKYGLEAGLLVTVTTHVSPSNINELDEMYKFVSDLGAHEFSLWESVPKKKGDPILSDNDRKRILNFYNEINTTETGPRIFSNTYFEGQMLGCLAGQRWLHVCVDGSVKPCPYLPFHFGNIENKSLKQIWKNIRTFSEFHGKKDRCLMHTPEFIELVDSIPTEAPIPYDFEAIKNRKD